MPVPKITKHKNGQSGTWRIHFDAKPSPLTIVKGDKPKYREPQEWHIMRDEAGEEYPHYMFTADSVGRAIDIIGHIFNSRT